MVNDSNGSPLESGAATPLVERVVAAFDRLTASEKKAARELLDHYPMPGLDTAAGFAARAGVSAPSVLRLVEKLGFDGYPAFQSRLREDLEARLQSPLQRRPEGAENFPGRYARQACSGIMSSIGRIADAEIEAVGRLLADQRRTVYVVGGRFSAALARAFQSRLHAVRGGVHDLSDRRSGWPELLLDLGRGDVVVVFDFRRYQKDVIRFAEDAADCGAVVVLITDQWRSPAARVASHLFPVRVDAPSRWDSMVAALVIVEILAALVSERRWKQASRRIRRLDRLQTQLHRVEADEDAGS